VRRKEDESLEEMEQESPASVSRRVTDESRDAPVYGDRAPPPPHKQADAISAIMKEHAELKVGQRWCLVGSDWLRSWIQHTGCTAFWQARPDEKAGPPPGPIDNSKLLNEKNDRKGNLGIMKIRLSAQEVLDFFLVPKEAWNLLSAWYGGGPVIERGTKLGGMISRRVKVDLHPVFLVLGNCTSSGSPAESYVRTYPREYTLKKVLADLNSEAASGIRTMEEEEPAAGEGKRLVPMEAETNQKMNGGPSEESGDDDSSRVRLWWLHEFVRSFPFKVGERVEAHYKGNWYPGDLTKLPKDDKYSRYNVLCDVDKDTENQPATMVKTIRRIVKKEGEGQVIKKWKPVEGRVLLTELGGLDIVKNMVCKLMVERKNSEGKWILEYTPKPWREFEQGDQVDCRDTEEKWLAAIVRQVRNDEIFVHYIGFDRKWDEWININSERLAKSGTKASSNGSYTNEDQFISSSGMIRGSVGLRNLGNTCFMNSTLQCMNATPYIANFFADGDYKTQINDSAYKSHGRIAREFGSLVQEMWAKKPHTVAPRLFKGAIGDFEPRFQGYAQQDSQELLACLLEGLHEDLNRVRKKPYDPNPVIGNGEDDEEAAEKSWAKYRKREDSVIIDNIYGQIRSRVLCPECHTKSVKFDPCGILQVPFPNMNSRKQIVTFVRADPSIPRKRYVLTVPKMGTVDDLKQALAEASGANQRAILFTEIYSKKVYRIFGRQSEIDRIQQNDKIYAYEVPDGLPREKKDETRGVTLKLKHACKASYGDGLEPFGTPFCIGVRIADEKISVGYLKGVVKKYILQHQRPEDRNKAQPWQLLYKADYYANFVSLKSYDQELEISKETELVVYWEDPDAYFEPEIVNDKTYTDLQTDERRDQISLQDCLTAFTNEEILSDGNEYRCPKCKKMQRGKKKLDLWRLPNILIIQLKRFQYTRQWRDKIDTYVDYPIVGLDLSQWTKSKENKKNAVYDLYAVSCHGGGLGGGHYWAHAKNLNNNQWYTLNDSSVSKASKGNVKTQEAYLLFYVRRGFDSTQAARQAEQRTVQSSSHSRGNRS